MISPRFAAWKILRRVLEEKQYSHVELQKMFRENPELSSRDRAFIERLVRGTLEHLYEIDACIGDFSSQPVKKLKPAIRTVLRLSVYQLLYMDSVPARAVCNEALKLAGRLKFGSLKGYVNGVLRNLGRALEGGYSPLSKDLSVTERFSLQYSMPLWILERYLSMFGEETTQALCRALMEPVRLSVYCNPMENSLEELKKRLDAEGAAWSPLPYGLQGVYLEHVNHLEQLAAFREGAFLVQDVSSMLQGRITSAQKGDFVVDVCGAPGGKTFHAAMDMLGEGRVDCADISPAKLKLIEENANRLKLENVTISLRDASVFVPELEEKADIVIADLPCSGLGIMGRKPEIRYNITEEDIDTLAALQRTILNAVWRYVKPGGRLIYSTCTLTEEEDEKNYQYLTRELPFEPESLLPYLPEGPTAETLEQGYLKLVPGLHASDGFFIGSAVRAEKKMR